MLFPLTQIAEGKESIRNALISRKYASIHLKPLDNEVLLVAERISNWEWKFQGGKGMFVIDRPLYASVSMQCKTTFVVR